MKEEDRSTEIAFLIVKLENRFFVAVCLTVMEEESA